MLYYIILYIYIYYSIIDKKFSEKNSAEKDPFALVLQDIIINAIKKES